LVARYASVGVTALGVLAVLAFKNFPTVYEAHGFFHSTLTPPLVVAIFLGIFWKKFTPAAVITTFVAGVGFMLLGARYPGIFIAPFDHGITMNPTHPYSYIRALYNMLVCSGVGVVVGLTTGWQKRLVNNLSRNNNGLIKATIPISIILFMIPLFNIGPSMFQFVDLLLLVVILPLVVTHYVSYDEENKQKD